jgi:hypothetical protein
LLALCSFVRESSRVAGLWIVLIIESIIVVNAAQGLDVTAGCRAGLFRLS